MTDFPIGAIVRIVDEPGDYRVLDDRGDRMLLQSVHPMSDGSRLYPSVVVPRDAIVSARP